jgi:hypothetical protein
MHVQEKAERCHNPEVSAAVLEPFIFSLIQDTLLDPQRIRACMGLFAQKEGTVERLIERQIEEIDSRLRAIDREKKRIVDIYASGDLSREPYVRKNLAYDTEAAELRMRVAQLHDRIPLLRKRAVVEASIAAFCDGAKARLNTCTDFDSKRQFLLDYIDKIVYRAGTVSRRGAVPIKLAPHEYSHQPTETPRIEFCIEGTVDHAEWRASLYRSHEHRRRLSPIDRPSTRKARRNPQGRTATSKYGSGSYH